MPGSIAPILRPQNGLESPINLTPYLTPTCPDVATVQQIVGATRPADPRRYSVRPRCRLLTRDLVPIALPNPQNSDDPSDLAGYVTAASTNTNETRDIVRQATLQFLQLPGLALDTLTHRIQIWTQWVDASGAVLFEVPQGVYRLSLPSRPISDAVNMYNIAANGLTHLVKKEKFVNTYVVPAGCVNTVAVKAMLTADKLPPDLGGRAATGTYPDGNAAGVAPSGCDCPGPNIPASQIDIPDSGYSTVFDTPSAANSGGTTSTYTGPLNPDNSPMTYVPATTTPFVPAHYLAANGNFYSPTPGDNGAFPSTILFQWDAGSGTSTAPVTTLPASQTGIMPTSQMATRQTIRLAFCNQLLDAVNYWPLYDDAVGTIQSSLMPDYVASLPPVDWSFVTDQDSVIWNVEQSLPDQESLVNAWTVESQNSQVVANGGGPLHVTAYNQSLDSLISIPNIGELWHDGDKQDLILDEATAIFYARLKLMESAATAEQFTFDGVPIPIDIHDHLSLRIQTKDGEVETGGGYPYRVIQYSVDYTTQTAKYVVQRVVGV